MPTVMIQDPEIKKAIKQFYILSTLYAAFFATANWLFFWRIFLSNGQVGVVDSICYLVGMLAEIPTGSIADKIGRRRIMILGSVLMGFGYATTGFAINGSIILIGYLIFSVGSSFYSGADDALMYDYLKQRDQEEAWEKIARNKQVVSRVSSLLAVFTGGYLYIANVRLPSIVRGVFFFLMLIPLSRMHFMDGAQPSKLDQGAASYAVHIWTGMKELLNRKMLPTILLVFVVQGVAISMFIGGILRPLLLERTGLPITDHANFISLISILAIIALLTNSKRLKAMTLSTQAIVWSATIIAGFALNIPAHSLVGGLLGIVLIHLGSYVLIPTTSTLINKSSSSARRATVLSTANLLEDVPYVVAGPFIGVAADGHHMTIVTEIIVTVMCVAVILSAIGYRRVRLAVIV